MELAAFQRQIEATYGELDQARGTPSTVAWLAEEVGELARAVRKGTRDEQVHELGDVLAWLVSLASQLDLSIEDAASRYAHGCPRCDASPCACAIVVNDTAPTVAHVVQFLGTRSNASDPEDFPGDSALGESPGLYAWWADTSGVAMLQTPFPEPVTELVYAGQAGASSSATLRSRVLGNHMRGNIYGSTMRRTLAAILLEELDLELVERRRLTPESETRLSQWISDHLTVVAIAIPDRAEIFRLEPLVLRELDPAFNLDHVVPTPNRERLRELRRGLERAPGTA